MSDRPTTVYKLMAADELAVLEQDGKHAGARDDLRDGFIHLSTAVQLEETIRRHGAGISDPQVVAVDAAAQGDALRWEKARGGDEFPHLYAPLQLDTVIAYGPLERDHDGTIKLPVAG